MMTNTDAPDLFVRREALDIQQSFIVQAPAGSGKTELLIQRYLILLANVPRSPEEILAITFTKKAASQMRARIMLALQTAATQAKPEARHAAHTWELARAVLKRDGQAGWQLLQNPQLLRIQTIDAFCLGLAASLPTLSGFGATPLVSQQPDACYLEAVQQFLATIEVEVPWALALGALLLHLGNDIERTTQLLVEQLKERDRWLPYVMSYRNIPDLKQYLENTLADRILSSLEQLAQLWPSELTKTLISLIHFALGHLPANHPLAICKDLTDLPPATLENQALWQAIGEFLLTKENEWRRKVDVNLGFPAPSSSKNKNEQTIYKDMKIRMQALLSTLMAHDELQQAWVKFLIAPTPIYDANQWHILSSLLILLPHLTAQLIVTFKQKGVVDFIEIAMSAIRALGTDEAPTDLALSLDYQIQHILIDEFQDTSVAQFRLFEALTREWMPGDGRTLFLVGDPMQSIYYFRQAEVGLFLKARDEGLGMIRLKPLVLTANFRSEKNIIDTLNQAFGAAMPRQENIAMGAVCYSPCVAMQANAAPMSVTVNAFLNQAAEAAKIVTLIQAERRQNAKTSIAILVRARAHLTHILPALQLAGIHYVAVEIESLQEKPIIYDLMALTRALLDLTDRTAWLAVLRAPWCGLTLRDLEILTQDPQALIFDVLQTDLVSRLSPEGQTRIYKIRGVLINAIRQRYQSRLRQWVYDTWLALQGPACLSQKMTLQQTDTYFNLLAQLDNNGIFPDNKLLADQVAKLRTLPGEMGDNPVQIMTIHKAKGLEFDCVILPGLNQRSPGDRQKLLKLLELPTSRSTSELLMAPIKARQDSHAHPIYTYLQRHEIEKVQYEKIRLLYVAMTRARNNLHLLATFSSKTSDITPVSGSLLEAIWPIVQADCMQTLTPLAIEPNMLPEKSAPALVRVKAVSNLTPLEPFSVLRNVPEYDKLDETATQIGKVLHQLLQKISVDGLAQWPLERIVREKPYYQRLLVTLGVKSDRIHIALEKICLGLQKTLTDPRGCWILANTHTAAEVEWPLSIMQKGNVQQVILDRTFIDEHDRRWIIDYKTHLTDEQDIQVFLQQAYQQYRKQLENYGKIMQHIETRPIYLGLYFPLQAIWHEWPMPSFVTEV